MIHPFKKRDRVFDHYKGIVGTVSELTNKGFKVLLDNTQFNAHPLIGIYNVVEVYELGFNQWEIYTGNNKIKEHAWTKFSKTIPNELYFNNGTKPEELKESDKIQSQIDELYKKLQIANNKEVQESLNKRTKKGLIKEYQGAGYIVDNKNRFYQVKKFGEFHGDIGLQVGEFSHSCHVDTTDFIVLFFLNESIKNNIGYFSDLWDIKEIKD